MMIALFILLQMSLEHYMCTMERCLTIKLAEADDELPVEDHNDTASFTGTSESSHASSLDSTSTNNEDNANTKDLKKDTNNVNLGTESTARNDDQ
jgi:hypothetical protein